MEPLISIIIPVLNEEQRIASTITHALDVAFSPGNIEIIVVDAGSADRTVLSIPAGCRLFQDAALAGRKYASLNLGIKQSNGNILVFLDADTLLPDNFDKEIMELLRTPGVVGGAFELEFSKSSLRLNLLQVLNQVRYRFHKEYFGDQAVFCRRKAAVEIGGFPIEPIMESAYFCRKLAKTGTLKLIRASVKTSARRFEENGFWKVFLFDLKVWLRFRLGLPTGKYGYTYWRVNQTNPDRVVSSG